MSDTSDRSQQRILPPCTVGLTSADLSAWRDEALPADEAERIASHHAGCPACQDRLRGFETVAAALHHQRAPIPDERLWRAVRAAILTSKPPSGADDILHETTIPDQSGVALIPHATARTYSRRRRALGTLAAVAAVALVVVSFGRLFQFGANNRPQPFQVHWRQVTLPDAIVSNPGDEARLSVFPADGSVAWLCQAGTKPAPGPVSIWRTIDSGATWRAVKAPAVAKSISCQLTLDQLEPDVALLQYGYIDTTTTPAMTQVAYAITFDGGAHWQDGSPFEFAREFATRKGAIYALRQTYDDSNSLEVSTDGGTTWNVLDDVLRGQKLLSDYFWINPVTGGLLLEAHSLVSPKDGYSFWTADANGSDWRKVGESPVGDMAAMPTSDSHWSICTLVAGMSTDIQHPDFRSHVSCGTDRGGWSERPGLDISRWGATPSACPGCGQAANATPYGAITLVGLANDGAVLATVEDRFNAKGEATRASLYRLSARSSQWENGGALPESSPGNQVVTYAPRPGGGILWSMPIQALDDHLAGDVYTASYSGPSTQPLPTQHTKALPTPTLTGNVDQGTPLEWQPINQPGGFEPKFTNSNILAVAPSDGQTAYACAHPNDNPTGGSLLGWVTRNGGATWTTLTLPVGSGWCTLVVDEVDPRDVLLGFSHNPPAGGPPMPELYYRSTDGGASWQGIPGLDGSVIYQFASYRGAVYALRDPVPNSAGDFAHVQVSTDGMIGWRTIDDAITGSAGSVGQFWLNPYHGVLLATNAAAPVNGIPMGGVATALIWRSSDGGAHWDRLETPPPPQGSMSNVFVQPPQVNREWGVCIASASTDAATLTCGNDSGQTWRTAPALDTGSATGLPRYIASTSDGAILAVVMATRSEGADTFNVYRLPAGAQRWQALGPTPEFSLIYAPAPGSDGTLWSVPAPGIVTDAQGRVFRVVAP